MKLKVNRKLLSFPQDQEKGLLTIRIDKTKLNSFKQYCEMKYGKDVSKVIRAFIDEVLEKGA